jgi:hypothetical protein
MTNEDLYNKLASQVAGAINSSWGNTLGTIGDPPWQIGSGGLIPGSTYPQLPHGFPRKKTTLRPKPAPLTLETLKGIIQSMLEELKKMSELASRFANVGEGPVLVFDPKDGKLKLQDRSGRTYVEREIFSFDGIEAIELPDWADLFDPANQPIVQGITTDNTQAVPYPTTTSGCGCSDTDLSGGGL